MSKRLCALLPLAFAGFAVLAAAMTSRAGAARDVTLVARGMAFYFEGDTTPNPTIHARAGETIRLVLRNDTPGVLHDLALAALDVSMAPIEAGAVGSISLRLPSRSGAYDYICRPHAQMMRGRLLVQAE
jgi:plastocyanin